MLEQSTILSIYFSLRETTATMILS